MNRTGCFTGTAVLALLSFPATAVTLVNSGEFGGNYYEVYEETSIGWNTARTDALSRTYQGVAGYLATITSAEENVFVADLLGTGEYRSWLGGADKDKADEWVWVDGPEAGQQFWQGRDGGTATGFANWAAAEPNDCCGGERYLVTNWASRGTWNDLAPGNTDTYGGVDRYVVEYGNTTPIPEPTSLALMGLGLGALALLRRRTR